MSAFLNFAGNQGITFKNHGTGGGTSFTLDVPASTNSVMLTIGGSLQAPGTDYTVSGYTITTTTSVTAGIEVMSWVVHKPGTAPTIQDNSVTTGKIPDSAVTTAKIADSNITTAKIADSNITTAKIADSSITEAKWGGNQLGGSRNLLINGAMTVAQRGTSSSTTSSGYKTIDRINNVASSLGASSNNITMSQVTDAPTGFSNSFKVNIDAAESPLSNANTSFDIRQRFEGQNLQQLKKGTSDAEKVTLSFYVKSNKTGTYIVQLLDKDNNRNISKSYTIDSSSTWQYKTITFEGDTTGTFDNDSSRSLDLIFALIKGTTYTSGTLATSWESQTSANEAVGQVNLADTLNNFWQITGVQLEVGDTATPFEHRSYGEELSACQRYYIQSVNSGSTSYPSSTGYARGMYLFPVQMRADPTGAYTDLGSGGSNDSNFTDKDGFFVTYASLGASAAGTFSWTMDAEL